MAANPLSPSNRQDPPERLTQRTARVGLTLMNTVRVPHDRFHDDRSAWYKTGGAMPAVVAGNQVRYMIDGSDAFPEMVAAIQTATGPGHFIYMINWFCDVDFNLVPETTLRALLLAAKGVKIRAMFWKAPGPLTQNADAVHFLNGVKPVVSPNGPVLEHVDPSDVPDNSAAIHDDRGNESRIALPIISIIPRAIGSQHQKILCVNGEQGLVCFVGGIDFNPDRISSPPNPKHPDNPVVEDHGDPLHDVHSRIIGPAALALVDNFVQKWNSHPLGKKFNADPKKGPLIDSSSLNAPVQKEGHIVQIGRTLPPNEYSFRMQGEQTAAAMITHAVRNAKRFIYTECQYFVGTPELEAAIVSALPRIDHLTVVLTHWEISDLPFVNEHRRKFFNKLRSTGFADKVRIYSIQPGGVNSRDFQKGHVAHTYVHAKIWIVDDEFAVIGTVNSNRRSWTHDSEAAAGIYEISTDQILHYRLAHWLRIEIWKEHLNMETLEGSAELADGVAGAVHWDPPPPGARVAKYDVNQRNDAGRDDQVVPVLGEIPIIGLLGQIGPQTDLLWDEILDPAYPTLPELAGA